MGKRKELRLEEKVSLVEECLAGRLRMREAARRRSMMTPSPSSWARRTSSFSSSGVPQRDAGAKKLDT